MTNDQLQVDRQTDRQTHAHAHAHARAHTQLSIYVIYIKHKAMSVKTVEVRLPIVNSLFPVTSPHGKN